MPGADPTLTASSLQAATERLLHDELLPHVADWDREDVLPDATLERIVDLGITGALVPTAHDGAGLRIADMVPVWRTLSQAWISITGAVNPTALATTLLVRHGTADQQARWLPQSATSGLLASFSITEPQAGSDLHRLETTVRAHPDGGLVVDGEKRWVAGGRSSGVVFLMALDRDAEKPSCAILPTGGRGTSSWRVDDLDKLGYRGVESVAYVFDDHHEAGAELLGGTDGAGQGPRQMLDALDVGRVNVACRALGIVDRALACAVDEAQTRTVGDGLLAEHTHAQLRLGELLARLVAVEALVLRAAEAVDAQREDAGALATAAKVVASDTAVWAVDRAARLAASRSYGADDELARLRRDAPQTQIGEGANDALLLALSKRLVG